MGFELCALGSATDNVQVFLIVEGIEESAAAQQQSTNPLLSGPSQRDTDRRGTQEAMIDLARRQR